MTFEEAIALQPAWIELWLNWLLFGAFILPLALLIWKRTRLTAIIVIVASVCGGIATQWLFGQMGYVKLLGLPHIIFWTPLSICLYKQIKNHEVSAWLKRIMMVILATILISLAFDYVDVLRYLLGERTPFVA